MSRTPKPIWRYEGGAPVDCGRCGAKLKVGDLARRLPGDHNAYAHANCKRPQATPALAWRGTDPPSPYTAEDARLERLGRRPAHGPNCHCPYC